MQLVEPALAIGLGFSLLACDGGTNPATSGGSCPTFTPCGGDIAGTWHFKSMCLHGTPTDAGACSTQTTGFATGAGYNATYTFGSNGSFTGTVSGTVKQTLSYPGATCSRSDASPATYCSELQQSMQSAFAAVADAGTVPINSLSLACTPSGSDVCTCDENLTYTPYTLSGDYTTSGDTLMVNITGVSIVGDGGIGDAGTSNPVGYCVSGNTLSWGPTPGSSDQGEGVIVFTR